VFYHLHVRVQECPTHQPGEPMATPPGRVQMSGQGGISPCLVGHVWPVHRNEGLICQWHYHMWQISEWC